MIISKSTSCGEPVTFDRRSYWYRESGLSNVVLQGVEIATCNACGNTDVVIPRMEMIHRAIAQALAEQNPGRMTGEQLRFLRKHLGLTGKKLASYLHTDATKISKWETGEDPIGESADRLVRLLVAALDDELRPAVSSVAQHIPQITDEPGQNWVLHVDVVALTTAFYTAKVA